MCEVTFKGNTLKYIEQDNSFLLITPGQSWSTCKIEGQTQNLHQIATAIEFDYSYQNCIAHVTANLLENNQIELTLKGEGALDSISFPGAVLLDQEDEMLYPLGDGIIVSSSDAPPIPQHLAFYCGSELSMGLMGTLRGQAGLFIGIENTCDAVLDWSIGENGTVRNQISFIGSKGKWAYERRLRIFFAEDDALCSLCAAYRSWRNEMGYVVPLLKKAEHAPRICDMNGRADVWIFDDNNMNRLYGRPEEIEKTPRDIRRVADEMVRLGMDKVLMNSFEGDSYEVIDYVKKKGFDYGRYDIYRDVLPKPSAPFIIPYRVKRSRHTEKCWPKDVRINENGEYALAWKLHGKDGKMYDQHSICDIPALRMTMEDVPEFVREGGYSSWFIDVGSGSRLCECFDPIHPADRRDAERYLKLQNQFLLDMGLINGVEVGSEATCGTYVFSEGMMSLPPFRAKNAGRNMNTLYYGDDIPSQITDKMLNPRIRIPLWQLVYHDCTVNYWYWGDSSNCCPELMPKRDLFNALYAVAPLYSLNMTQWEKMKEDIAASYSHASLGSKYACFSPMTRFDYLSEDRSVQRTSFENGVSITVNFGEKPFGTLPPFSCFAVNSEGNKLFSF